jgi:hypothetical protein
MMTKGIDIRASKGLTSVKSVKKFVVSRKDGKKYCIK